MRTPRHGTEQGKRQNEGRERAQRTAGKPVRDMNRRRMILDHPSPVNAKAL